MTKTAKQWRAEGFPIPDFVPDGMKLADVEITPNGVTWRQTWDNWDGHELLDEELELN